MQQKSVCPVCNGLNDVLCTCPNCGIKMQDVGAITDYLGPYTAYEENNSSTNDTWQRCWHSAVCPECGYQQSVTVPLLPDPA